MMSVTSATAPIPAPEPPSGGVPDASALSFLASLVQVMGLQAAAPVRPEQAAAGMGSAGSGALLAPAAGGGTSLGFAVGGADASATGAGPAGGEAPSPPSTVPSPSGPSAVVAALDGDALTDANPEASPGAPRPAVASTPPPPGPSRPKAATPKAPADPAAATAGVPTGAAALVTAGAEGASVPKGGPENTPGPPAGHDTQPGADPAGKPDLAPPADLGSVPAGPSAWSSPTTASTGDAGAVPTSAPPRIPLPMLAGEVVRAVEHGRDALTIELEPVDLGRVEVSLTVDGNGRLRAELAAERPETLQLLQRDARSLEQALAGGGVVLADAGLSFSLRQDHRGGAEQQPPGPAARFAEAQPAAVAATPEPARRPSNTNRLLDLSV